MLDHSIKQAVEFNCFILSWI